MAKLTTFATNNLNAQGFGGFDEDVKARYAWSLRFTPAVAIGVVLIGLFLQSPSGWLPWHSSPSPEPCGPMGC
jgi:hypothetical protein